MGRRHLPPLRDSLPLVRNLISATSWKLPVWPLLLPIVVPHFFPPSVALSSMPAARDREWGRGRGRGQGQGLGRPAPRADMDWLAGSGRAVPVLEPVLPVVEMPRDSRGSLEVFGGAPARDRDRGPQVPALLPVTRARTPGRGRNCHSDGEGEGEEEKEGEEMEVESKWMAIPGGGPGKKAPVLMKEGAAKEAYPLPEKVELGLGAGTVAERAAQWGLVAKEELGRGRVGTRRSGEEAEEERKSGTSGRTSGGSEGEVVVPRVSRQVKEALGSFQQTFVVSDALQPGYPILYASAGFFSMTGYSAQEVMGHSCRFLQGADTDPEDVNKIRAALHDGTTFCGRILNYKKDGTPFWNLLTIAPIKDDTGRTIKFIGMQVEVSKFTEGSQATALRPNGLPHSLIKYDARQKATLSGSGAVADLVTAVTKPHKVIAEQEQEHGGGAAAPVPRRASQTGRQSIEEGGKRQQRSSGFLSLLGLERKVAEERDPLENFPEPELIMVDEEEREEEEERSKEMRRGIDLATTLERIEKNFVITDPRLPDNPIIFASDHFLELTEYRREEVLGRNCRFLQGPDTDRETVRMIGDAVRERREATVQLLNYTKSGKAFWNLFHLQPMRDQRGELQYFIGVQLDGSEQEATRQRLSERTEQESAAVVRATAHNVDAAASTLADAGLTPADLWVKHSKTVTPRPHKVDNPLWHAIRKVQQGGERLGLKHFRPIRPLGCGDTGSVHLVELRGSGLLYAMKAMDKSSMVNRNKVHRACAEREILGMMDHPFLPTLYASFQTTTHLCLITDFCPGGELFLMLERQPMKVLEEEAARFYAAEVVIALQYLHCMGVIYRDLKPENVLLQGNGHILLTDFDLSFLTSSRPRLIDPTPAHAHSDSSRRKRRRDSGMPIFCAEPTVATNSFVGTEEYIAPEIIAGAGHSAAVDWWALGILLYEMLYGRTPFRGRNRQKTFVNILNKELTFPTSIPVSLAARQLIRALLQRDPSSRLGALRGAHDIKTHPFFRSINWPLIRCSRPPLLDTPVHPDADIPMKTAHPADLEWDDMEATPHHHVTTSFTDVF